MTMASAIEEQALTSIQPEYDAIIIGAGVCGIYQLYKLQEMGLKVITLEAADDVGGTWYKNRYPGCRFDSESVTYGYSFSKELLQEWSWTEHFAGRAETERYLRFVVEKFDLRHHMKFNSTVKTARYDEQNRLWQVTTDAGQVYSTRFLLTAVGVLSTPTMPKYKGMDSFKGQSFHTYHFPKEPVDFTGKRVAVIGTGATGVQLISEIADKVGELTVFQRRPNWCAPLGNSPISSEEMEEIRGRYDEIFRLCSSTPSGFWHQPPDNRATVEVPEAERLAFWEKLYTAPGFGIWVGNYKDIVVDEEANAIFSAFIAEKIRQRVRDPKVAEKLIPKDHGFGTRRVPLETRYYEAYNRDNVHLVDVSETPIESVTESGIRTTEREYEFDIIVYATGFDALTGAFDKIEIIGKDGLRLKDKWDNGPLTTYGLLGVGFPNLITLAGPQSGSVATNFPRSIETVVDWATGLMQFMLKNGYSRIEPKQEAEDRWQVHLKKQNAKSLISKQKSWFTGYNSNLDRSQAPRDVIYGGGALRYRYNLEQEVQTNYSGFNFE